MDVFRIELGRRSFLLAAAASAGAVAGGGPATARVAGGGPAAAESALPTLGVGAFQVIPLLDAVGSFPANRSAVFPEATADDWERARIVDPEAFGPGETWRLSFRCYAIHGPGDRLVIVDTGVGPDGSPAGGWAPTPGRLPSELELAGIDPADVDTVVLTHLHEDHFGWSVRLDGTPVFRNARYVIQRREVTALPDGDAALGYVVDPLRSTGQLVEVDGVSRLATGRGRVAGSIRVIPTPGHTPGHQSVVVDSGGDQVIVTGDVLVHAVQLVDPEVAYRFEADHEESRRTRRRLLTEARARGAVLATAHLNQPWTELG